MTTYTKETALYDTGAIAGDIQEAGTKADNYLTDVSGGGVMVHPSDDSTSGWKISSTLELLKSGVSYIWAGLVNNIATVRIGKEAGGHSVIDEHGMRVYGDTDGSKQLANIGYGEGANATGGTSVAPYYSMGIRADENDDFIHDYVGTYSTSKTYNVGDLVLYNNSVYICEIEINTPESWTPSHWSVSIGNYSNSEGAYTISAGYASHAEGGYGTTASGTYSHAEGENTRAIGDCSHVEGMDCIAKGESSHAEGIGCMTIDNSSHAEGMNCIAKGECSHAGNYETIASGFAQTTLGLYNIEDNTPITNLSNPYVNRQYALIIGNGTADDARSNALTVDWSGNVDAAGSIISDANYEDAWHDSTQGYTVSGVSLAGSTYLGQAIRLEKVSATNKHPIFNGFDISGTGTARIHTLGHYIGKTTYNDEQYWYAYIKMRNDNTSAINNFDVTAYIAWI